MNKQIVRRFQEFAQANRVELELENTSFKLFKISEVADFKNNERVPIAKGKRVAGEYPYYGASGIVDYVNDFIFSEELLLVSEDGDNLKSRKAPIAFIANGKYWVNNHAHILKPKEFIDIKYLSYVINNHDLDGFARTDMIPKLNKEKLSDMPVIFPVDEGGNISLKIQEILVRFIEYGQSSHQRRLDGCALIRPILDKMERSVVPRTLEKSRGARKLIKQFLQKKGIELDYEKVEFEEKSTSEIGEFKGGLAKYTAEYIKANPGEFPIYSASTDELTKGMSGKINSFDYDEECIHLTKNGENTGTVFLIEKHKHSLNGDRAIYRIKDDFEIEYIYFLLKGLDLRSRHNWGNKLSKTNFEEYKLLIPKDLPGVNSKSIQKILTSFFSQYLERVNHNRRVADKLERQIAEYRETYLKLFFKSLKQKAHAD